MKTETTGKSKSTSSVHSVHQGEERRNNRRMDLLLLATTDRCQSYQGGVNIDELNLVGVNWSLPSISSKKMILGWHALASSKSKRNCRSASPTHLLKQSAPFRIKNAAIRTAFSGATAGGEKTQTHKSSDPPCYNLLLKHEQVKSFQYQEVHERELREEE